MQGGRPACRRSVGPVVDHGLSVTFEPGHASVAHEVGPTDTHQHIILISVGRLECARASHVAVFINRLDAVRGAVGVRRHARSLPEEGRPVQGRPLQDLSGDEHEPQRGHGVDGTVTQRADSLVRRAVARAGLDHRSAHTLGGLRDRVGRSALGAAALGTSRLGGGVAAVRVGGVRRHATTLPDLRLTRKELLPEGSLRRDAHVVHVICLDHVRMRVAWLEGTSL